MITGICTLASVSQVIANGSWLLPRGRHPVILLLRACLPATPPTLSPLDSDFYLWRNSLSDAPGNFSSSKTWASLHPHSSEQVSWFKSVWFSQRIPKHAFILWVTLRDRLTTRDRLRSWGLSVPGNCLLCSSALETKSHRFFECDFGNEVWTAFFSHRSLSPPSLFDDIVRWVKSPSPNSRAQYNLQADFSSPSLHYLERKKLEGSFKHCKILSSSG